MFVGNGIVDNVLFQEQAPVKYKVDEIKLNVMRLISISFIIIILQSFGTVVCATKRYPASACKKPPEAVSGTVP